MRVQKLRAFLPVWVCDLFVLFTRVCFAGVEALVDALEDNRSLVHLNISNNNVAQKGIEKLKHLFEACLHDIEEFIFQEESVSDSLQINLLFSLNGKPMKLINFGAMLCLCGEKDWRLFYNAPLCFSAWCLFLNRTTDNRAGSDFPSDARTFVGKELLANLVRMRNGLTKNRSDSVCYVTRSDARDALRLAIGMVGTKINDVSGFQSKKSSDRPIHIKAGHNHREAAWLLDQMIGADGKRGIMISREKGFAGFGVYGFPDSSKPLSYWHEGPVDISQMDGERIRVDEADFLVDLWSCGEHCKIGSGMNSATARVMKDLIESHLFKHLQVAQTALLCALGHHWRIEHEHNVAGRLLNRNRYSCKIRQQDDVVPFDLVIRCDLDDEQPEDPNLDRILLVFEKHPDICNVNAKRHPVIEGSKAIGALGLAASNGMGRVITKLMDLKTKHEWDLVEDFDMEKRIQHFLDSSMKEPEKFWYQSNLHESEMCNDADASHVEADATNLSKCWKNAAAVDDTTGLSFLSFVCQTSPENVRHMMDYAMDICERTPGITFLPDKRGRLPTHFCAVNGHVDLMNMLLTCSWMPQESIPKLLDKKDDCGWSAMALAVANGHAEIIEMLLNKGASAVDPKVHADQHPLESLMSNAFELCLLQNNLINEVVEICEKEHKSKKAQVETLADEESSKQEQESKDTQLRSSEKETEKERSNLKAIVDGSKGEDDPHLKTPREMFTANVYAQVTDMFEEESFAALASLQTSLQKSEDVQAVFKNCEAVADQGETPASMRDSFVTRLLFERLTRTLVLITFITIVALHRAGKLTGEASTRFTNLLAGEIIFEQFPENATPLKVFRDIANIEDFWEWVAGPLLGTLWSDSGAVGKVSYLVGAVRFEQIRNIYGTCPVSGLLAPIPTNISQPCLSSIQDRASFGPNLTFAFDGRSHVTDIPAGDSEKAEKTLLDMKEADWFDDATRFVQIQFSIYNVYLDNLVSFLFKFDSSRSGDVRPMYRVVTITWGAHHGVESLIMFVFETVLLFITFFNTYRLMLMFELGSVEVRVPKVLVERLRENFTCLKNVKFTKTIRILKRKQDVHKDVAFRVLCMLLLDLWAVLGVYALVLKNTTHFNVGPEQYVDTGRIAFIYQLQNALMAMALVSAWLLLCTYLQLIPTLGPMIQAVNATMLNQRVLLFVVSVLLASCTFVRVRAHTHALVFSLFFSPCSFLFLALPPSLHSHEVYPRSLVNSAIL
jgi:hypothetical protein